MTAVILVDTDAGSDLAWALRLADAHDDEEARVWTSGGEAPTLPDGFTHERLEGDDPIAETLRRLQTEAPTPTLLLFVQRRQADAAGNERRRRLLRDAPCELVVLYPGVEGAGVLVAVASGPHARTALRLGHALARTGVEPADALYVEPPVGWDAERVGRRILDRHVRNALGDDHAELGRMVVVSEGRADVIGEAAAERGAGLVLIGAAKRSALGHLLRRTVGQKVLRQAEGPAVGLCRAALPLGSRFQRRLEALLQRAVPQLHRDERLVLVERVQSSSHWDFDFVTLMSLATLISALGLVQSSAAVIIGAMLVAPMMTPILGLGLALVQGNDHLARGALRTVTLGFVTAFLLSLGVGLAHMGFDTPTPEMLLRDWPDLTDLSIAFLAGLAAAYASSRPGLIAALPGVAIAAALVPPIATAGLAAAVGAWRLSAGASLLFLVNAVAIVLASAVSLWAVGLRYLTTGSRLARRVGWGALALLLGLGVLLAL